MDYGIYWHSTIIIYLTAKVKTSGIWTCSLSCLIFIFFFWGLYFSKSFDISFRNFYHLFDLLLLLLFFQNMGKQLAESKVCTYLHDYQSQLKNYESYIYRTLTPSLDLLQYIIRGTCDHLSFTTRHSLSFQIFYFLMLSIFNRSIFSRGAT